MIYSMTGFAATTRETPQGNLALELRTVNHRYLDVSFRLDENLRALEPALREAIAARTGRGKVECRLSLAAGAEGDDSLRLNIALVRQLVDMGHLLQEYASDSRPLSVSDILRWPGVVGGSGATLESLRQPCLDLLQQALEELSASRAREGEKLKAFLLERLAQMETVVAGVLPHLPRLIAAYQEKLSARLHEALGNADDERIRQELALFAQKIDVDEELSRLRAHFSEVRRILDKGGAVGKRLDFLMQELNREANTLGSKSVAVETSQASMDMKILIEQMREQIQNLE
jgi:uncharacterized protein (TIGR00255 family)